MTEQFMRKIYTRIAALSLLAVSVPALGQANPHQFTTCEIVDEDGGEMSPVMCHILVVGNLSTALGEQSEAIADMISR